MRGLGDTYQHEFLESPPMLHPFRVSNPTYNVLFLRIHPTR